MPNRFRVPPQPQPIPNPPLIPALILLSVPIIMLSLAQGAHSPVLEPLLQAHPMVRVPAV